MEIKTTHQITKLWDKVPFEELDKKWVALDDLEKALDAMDMTLEDLEEF